MKQEQLNAIKERAAKATKGPWLVEESRYEGRFNAASVDENYDLPACLMGIDDADFVTHSREDVPALVAEVERLQKLLDIEERNSSDYLKASTGLFKKVEILNSENSKFRKALEEIMDDQAPIMEGWETTTYEIARKALGGEAK